ncbi:hypothetical protein HOO54_22235 [Bacillus sp. WMMC1349]|uniref:hypothetical protein n=1 Tax=Bacillus sp. WMMC1349 TaxID=2736254 RepID=UPI0015516E10|nr:hypothetical protein [Bacillus sp. WMMC1349]NPC94817.1 hypothetical protein [Bacillus sp. WMMC1349]NPC94865.1 hypothetical protein [Bacillus sp. WMMC1349]
MANMKYQMPVTSEKGKSWAAVWIKGFEIKNRNAFSMGDAKESQLNLELTFNSNDYSTEKYTQFINDLIRFLNEHGWTEGKQY